MKRVLFALLVVFFPGLLFQTSTVSAFEYQPLSLAKSVEIPGENSLPDHTQLQAAILNISSHGGDKMAASEYISKRYRYFVEVSPYFLPVSYCMKYLRISKDREVHPYTEVISGFENTLYMVCIIYVDDSGVTEFSGSSGGISAINHIPNSPDFRVSKIPR